MSNVFPLFQENSIFRLSYSCTVGEGQCPSHQKWNILDFPKGKYWIACGNCDFVPKSLGGAMPLPYSVNGAINTNLADDFLRKKTPSG